MVEFVIVWEFREIQVRDKDNEEIQNDDNHDKDGKDTKKEIPIVPVIKRHHRERR